MYFSVCATGTLNPLSRELDESLCRSFGLASLTMFQLLTGDSWSGVLYSAMQAFPEEEYIAKFFGALLVMTWFIFASLIAKNLFVAVIIENFQISDTITSIGKPGKVHMFRSLVKSAYSSMYKRSSAVISGNLEIDTNTGLTHPVQVEICNSRFYSRFV